MAEQEIMWELIGAKVPAGQSVSLDGGVVSGNLETPHITQVALGADPKPGRHTVFIEANDTKVAIGTLEKDRCEQFQVDIVANDMVFSHTGKSDIYVSGYNSISAFDIESSEEESEEEDEDDEDVPAAVPLRQQNLLPSKTAKAKQQAMLNEQKGLASLKNALSGAPIDGKDFSDMEDDDDEDEDDDQNAPQSSRSIKAVPRPKSFNEFTLSDIGLQLEDDDDDDDEEEDEEADADAHALARAMAEVDDSDDEDDEDDSDEEDEEEAAPQVPAVVKGKRAAAAATTPQVVKKVKLADGKAPASAPAKASSQPSAGAPEAQWEKELKAFLQQGGGEAQMSVLGSVKKPEGIAKTTRLKAFLQARPKSFVVSGDNKVSLK